MICDCNPFEKVICIVHQEMIRNAARNAANMCLEIAVEMGLDREIFLTKLTLLNKERFGKSDKETIQ